MKTSIFAALAAVTLAGMAAQAHAEVLPAASFSGTLSYGADGCEGSYAECFSPPNKAYKSYHYNGVPIGPGTTGFSASAHTNSTSGSVSYLPGLTPTLAAGGSFTAIPVNAEDAGFVVDERLNYSFWINGPQSTVAVNVAAAGSLSGDFHIPSGYTLGLHEAAEVYYQIHDTSPGNDYGQTLTAYVQYGAMFPGATYYSPYGGTSLSKNSSGRITYTDHSFSGQFADNSVYMLATNTRYDVSMFLTVNGGAAGNPGGGYGSLQAFLDPTISLTQAAADSGVYSITFSEGLNPSGGVPEPTTWALTIGGLGLAGAALRRRRAAVL